MEAQISSAPDSRAIYALFSATKIKVIGHQIVGCAGLVQDINKFMRWLKDPTSEYPEFSDNDEKGFDAILLNKDGIFCYSSSCVGDKVDDPFLAIGSGGRAAKAAMIMGASPRRAVEVASQCDKNTKLPVQRVILAKVLKTKLHT